MENCYQHKDLIVKFDKERKILFSYWSTNIDMHDDEYKRLFESYLKCIEKYKPEFVFVNAVKAFYAIPIEIQDWINLKTRPLYELYRTRKIAVLMSTDFIAQLSFEQVMDDSKVDSLQVQFFEDEDSAISWLEKSEVLKRRVA